jgi:hypothetical protein
MQIAGFAGVHVDDGFFGCDPFQEMPFLLGFSPVGLTHDEDVHPVFTKDLFIKIVPEWGMDEFFDILFADARTEPAGF